jgi:hypothetical protein
MGGVDEALEIFSHFFTAHEEECNQIYDHKLASISIDLSRHCLSPSVLIIAERQNF